MAMIRATIRTGCECLLLALSALPGIAGAASVSYYLNQSNELANGTDYLEVTLADATTSNTVDVRVDPLTPLSNIAGTRFGIQKFAFDLEPGVSATGVKISRLPDSWWVMGIGKIKMRRFRHFEFGLRGAGDSRQDPLSFTVNGLKLSDIRPYFAAQVAGFDSSGIRSAYFGGGVPVAPVPLPAALWLMIGGLATLVGIARRRTAPA